jgi:hypothetical protein
MEGSCSLARTGLQGFPRARPIELSGACGIDQSSGLIDRDRAVLAGWAEKAEDVDLSATARGRYVRVKLPPVAPVRPLGVMPGPAPRSLCR